MMAGEQRRRAAEALGLPEQRPMPASVESEQAVLGALLLDNGLFSRVSDLLTPEMFYEGYGTIHRRVFELIAAWVPQGKVVNAVTMKPALGDPDLGGATLSEYLARLRAEAGLPQEIRGYATILRDLYIRRCVIGIAEDARDRAYDAPLEDTGKALVDAVLERLGALRTDSGDRTGFEDFETVSMRAVLAAEASFQAGGQLVGLSTGIPRLDDALGGLRETDFIVIAGRPGMGKSALAGQIGFAVARALQHKRKQGDKTGVVGVFSLEMSREQFVERLICMEAGVPSWKIRRGKLTAADVEAMNNARRELGRLPFEIDATPALSIKQLALRAKALHKRYGLALLIVDYIQLMQGGDRAENRTREMTEITTGLKTLAKELDVPVIGLSQLNRDLERRDDKRPILADLKESGSIEQDADMVLFVYRDEYYLGKPPAEGTEARLSYDRKLMRVKGVAEIIIGKNRHGPSGFVELGFDGSVTRFMNEPEPREEIPEIAFSKPKKASLHKDSTVLYGLLRNLTLSDSETPTPEMLNADRNLRRTARIIPVEKARDRFQQQLYGPDAKASVIEKDFRERMKELAREGLAYWTGTEGHAYVWLPEQA